MSIEKKESGIQVVDSYLNDPFKIDTSSEKISYLLDEVRVSSLLSLANAKTTEEVIDVLLREFPQLLINIQAANGIKEGLSFPNKFSLEFRLHNTKGFNRFKKTIYKLSQSNENISLAKNIEGLDYSTNKDYCTVELLDESSSSLQSIADITYTFNSFHFDGSKSSGDSISNYTLLDRSSLHEKFIKMICSDVLDGAKDRLSQIEIEQTEKKDLVEGEYGILNKNAFIRVSNYLLSENKPFNVVRFTFQNLMSIVELTGKNGEALIVNNIIKEVVSNNTPEGSNFFRLEGGDVIINVPGDLSCEELKDIVSSLAIEMNNIPLNIFGEKGDNIHIEGGLVTVGSVLMNNRKQYNSPTVLLEASKYISQLHDMEYSKIYIDNSGIFAGDIDSHLYLGLSIPEDIKEASISTTWHIQKTLRQGQSELLGFHNGEVGRIYEEGKGQDVSIAQMSADMLSTITQEEYSVELITAKTLKYFKSRLVNTIK